MQSAWAVPPMLLLLCFGAACGRGEVKKVAQERPKSNVRAEPWAAVSLAPTGPPAYLANSRLGLRFSHSGLGCAPDGEPMQAFLMSDNSLLRIQHPAAGQVWINGSSLLEQKPLRYESRLDFRTAVLTVEADYAACKVRIETLVHAQSTKVSQRIRFEAPSAASIKVWIGIPSELANAVGDGAANWSDLRYSCPVSRVSAREALPLPPLGDVEVRILSRWDKPPKGSWTLTRSSPKRTLEGRGFLFEGELPAGTTVFETCASVDSGPPAWFEDCLVESRAIWDDRWATDLEIDGPVEDQQAIRSFLFYAYMSSTSKMPPMALSSDKYNGHRFWDAEAWMLPVYALIRPSVAKAATDWRIAVMETDARIPWETGATGDDLTPPEFRRAIHVAGWVSWWLERAVAFGFVEKSSVDSIQSSIAEFYRDRAVEKDGRLEIHEVMGPEEGKLVDNDLVTNLLAIKSGLARGEDSSRVSELSRLRIPTDREGVPLSYDHDAAKGYQQATAVLALYPIEWPFSRAIAEKLFDRYKGKVSASGPAMSDSVHAVIAARFGRQAEAYSFWRQSWRPFVRPEFMLFSERRSTDDVYFATGAAGCLQSVIYGFLGLHIEKNGGETSEASKSLAYGYRLAVRPNLPKEWRSITFKNVRLPGGNFTIRATHDGAEILPGGE